MRGSFWSVLQGFLLVTVAIRGQAKQIIVGGQDGWTRGRLYETIRADIGDELVRVRFVQTQNFRTTLDTAV